MHHGSSQIGLGRSRNPDHGAVDLHFYRDIVSSGAIGDHRHEHRLRIYRAAVRFQRVAKLPAPGVELRGPDIVPPCERRQVIAMLRLCDDRELLLQGP